MRSEFETFPDVETVENLLADGDKVAVPHRFRGTQRGRLAPYPPSGKQMTADDLAVYRLENGLNVEAWVEWDNLGALIQLGHYQPPGKPHA